ncbi:MAG TPA: hypothetical protein VF719_04230 [Abditibacteriaceae bacterium]
MQTRGEKATLAFLILSQVITAISLAPWFMMAIMSFMAFDGGIVIWAVVAVAVIWSYPLWVLLGSVMMWLKYKGNAYLAACLWALLPYLFVLLVSVVASRL